MLIISIISKVAYYLRCTGLIVFCLVLIKMILKWDIVSHVSIYQSTYINNEVDNEYFLVFTVVSLLRSTQHLNSSLVL